jgi:hypothetical protein
MWFSSMLQFFKKGEKHHHVLYAWWFQMLIKFIPYFFFVVSLFLSTILIFLMIILNSCYFISHFEFIFQISWTYWIPIVSISYWTIVSIFYWIDEVSILFLFQFIIEFWCFISHNHIQLLFQFSHKKHKHNSKIS